VPEVGDVRDKPDQIEQRDTSQDAGDRDDDGNCPDDKHARIGGEIAETAVIVMTGCHRGIPDLVMLKARVCAAGHRIALRYK
jgi:hypothetical protein